MSIKHTSSSFLQQLAAQSTDITFIFDIQQNQFLFLSESAYSLLALSREQINENPQLLVARISEEDRAYLLAEIKKLREEGPLASTLEFRLYMPDQTTRWMRMKVFALEEASGERYLGGIAEDFTKRKEYELALMAMKEQKNIVIQVLGHDLRAPLNTISMSMSLLNKEIGSTKSESVQQLVDIVERTCRNSLDMIKEVLNLEYIETQEMGIKKTRIDLVGRIQSQLDAFRLLDKSHKTFLLHTTTETLFSSIDSIRLMLITENLLTNAYKFTEAGGRIEVSLEERPDTILITVADNGIGIPDTLQPLIFDKFTKARRKGTSGEPPVGLGMHLIKTMVDQLEGRIWFESREGAGTTFYVELPK
jgi:two-component system, OmpR family, sensor histidine kinase VicK